MSRKVVCFGEVLFDMLPEGARIGGAPLNVCYHLQKAGVKAKIISQVGNDSLGENLIQEAKELGVDASFIALAEDYPTSTVEVTLNAQGSASYQIVDHVAWDYIPFDAAIAQEVAAADAFIFGSLVTRNEYSKSTLLQYLQHSSYNIMDINLRAPFFTKENIFEMLRHVHFLKINEEETQILGNWMEVEDFVAHSVINNLFKQFSTLKEVLLTRGEKAAIYFTSEIEEKVDTYQVQVQDTIGCGDSFLAGFLAKKLQGESVKSALEYAALISGFVATQSGAMPYYEDSTLKEFAHAH